MRDDNGQGHDKEGRFNGDNDIRNSNKLKTSEPSNDIAMRKSNMYGDVVVDKYPNETKRFNALMAKVVKVDLSSDVQKQLDNAKSANEQRKIIKDYIMQKLRGKYRASDGRIVTISARTAKKYTSNFDDIKLRASPAIADMLNKSELVGIVDVAHSRFDKFAYYDTMFEIGDKTYVGRLNVGIVGNGEATLYELNNIKQY